MLSSLWRISIQNLSPQSSRRRRKGCRELLCSLCLARFLQPKALVRGIIVLRSGPQVFNRKVREGAPRTQRTSLRASGTSLRSLRSKSFLRGQASSFWEPLNLNFKLQLHPVIRQSHVGRQRYVRLLVRQIVTDMSEESALRPQSLDDLQ